MIVGSLKSGTPMSGIKVVRLLVNVAQLAGGAALFLPRFRFPGGVAIVVACIVSVIASRPSGIPAQSWFYINAMIVVLAGIVAFKSLPPKLAERFQKNHDDDPPPVF
jgi:hypothetical protein